MIIVYEDVKKTLCEKEKLLVTAIFSFSTALLLPPDNSGFCGKVVTLSQMINFEIFQPERVCRRQFQVLFEWQKVLKKCRKHCGKRKNCSLCAISPFLTVFLKDF